MPIPKTNAENIMEKLKKMVGFNFQYGPVNISKVSTWELAGIMRDLRKEIENPSTPHIHVIKNIYASLLKNKKDSALAAKLFKEALEDNFDEGYLHNYVSVSNDFEFMFSSLDKITPNSYNFFSDWVDLFTDKLSTEDKNFDKVLDFLFLRLPENYLEEYILALELASERIEENFHDELLISNLKFMIKYFLEALETEQDKQDQLFCFLYLFTASRLDEQKVKSNDLLTIKETYSQCFGARTIKNPPKELLGALEDSLVAFPE